MRTYSRKPKVHEIIQNAEALCRLCLGKCDAGVPIFDEQTDKCYSSLATRIMMCVGLEMVYEKCLSNHICIQCYEEVQKYYTFRVKCEMTYQKLKHHVLAMRRLKGQMEIKNIETEPTKKFIIFGNDAVLCKQGVQENDTNKTFEDAYEYNGNDDDKREENVTDLKPIKQNPQNLTEAKIDEEEVPSWISSLVKLGVLSYDGENFSLMTNSKRVELEAVDGSLTIEFEEEIDQEENQNVDTEQKEDLNKETVATDDSGTQCEKREINERSVVRGVSGRVLSSRWSARRHGGCAGAAAARPHACSVCQRRFAQREVCARHELVHRAVKPFKCEQCPKSYTQRSSLLQHSRVHAPPSLRVHACLLCDKLFLHASALSRHKMGHTSRRFFCNYCNKQFKYKCSLARHIKDTCTGSRSET